MQVHDDIFATSPQMRRHVELLGGKIPALLIDNFYENPDLIRELALGLTYTAPPYPYPGTLAVTAGSSLEALKSKVLQIVNTEYLPNVPPIMGQGRRIHAFREVLPDFARVELHPDDLAPVQRVPHTDPVPIFGLVYLNREERGGTLFFEQKAVANEAGRSGYFTESSPEFELLGRIEGRFNRLAIYPGFVPHSGEIVGDWIRGEERFTQPRITQRLVFMA
jgi:hypothetical protein